MGGTEALQIACPARCLNLSRGAIMTAPRPAASEPLRVQALAQHRSSLSSSSLSSLILCRSWALGFTIYFCSATVSTGLALASVAGLDELHGQEGREAHPPTADRFAGPRETAAMARHRAR